MIRRKPQRQQFRQLVLLLSLCFGGSVLLSGSGCGLLFPEPHKTPVKPDRPDTPVTPDKNTDPYAARAGMAAALAKAAASKAECGLLYAIFAGSADYVQGLPNDTTKTTTTLGEAMQPMLLAIGWPSDKYPDVKTEISRAWTAAGFKETPGAFSDVAAKQKLLDLYRNIAHGCKDAFGIAK
jgi:hypothetical protein